jgi:glycosyltransferase involved in cell wall biosynthesis
LPALPDGRVGIAATRNRALEHLLDGWVITADSDDYLNVDGTVLQLARTELAGAFWSAALANDIDSSNREIYKGPNYFAEGLLKAGVFLEHTLRNDLPPWRCSAMVIDAELIKTSEGWATTPMLRRIEDTAMVARITSSVDGLWVPLVVQVYRKHDQQTTADPDWLKHPRRLDLLTQYAADPVLPL